MKCIGLARSIAVGVIHGMACGNVHDVDSCHVLWLISNVLKYRKLVKRMLSSRHKRSFIKRMRLMGVSFYEP